MKKKVILSVSIVAVICLLMAGAFFAGRFTGKDKSASTADKADVQTTEQPGGERGEETAPTGETAKDTTESTTPEAADNAVRVVYDSTGSWEQDGMIFTQFDVTIFNDTDKEIGNWNTSLTVPKGSKLNQGWNAEYTLKGTGFAAVPMEYNQKIPAGGSVNYGFILQTKEAFSPEKTVVVADDTRYDIAHTPDGGTVADAKKTQESADGGKAASEKDTAKDTTGKGKSGGGAKTGTKTVTGEKNPVKTHGRLSVKGTQLVDAKGKAFALRGISTHGIAWFPEYVSRESFASLKELYGINAVRLAMYSAPDAGYTKQMHEKVKEGVKYATQEGLYVIVDWHILGDGNPNTYKKEAKAFFKEMAKACKGNKNVIYEICNEPNGDVTWERDVKPYAKELVKTIRKIDKKAVIIVGTPTWSQDVDVVADSPLKGQKNVMYALHFYAATHKDDLRKKAQSALDKGLPLFVSEFSICEASGAGTLDYDSAAAWMKFCNDNTISMMSWSLCNKDEAASLLKSSCKKTSDYTADDLSDTGKWWLEQFSK